VQPGLRAHRPARNDERARLGYDGEGIDDAEVDPGDRVHAAFRRELDGDLCADVDQQTVRLMHEGHGADLVASIGQLARQTLNERQSAAREL